MSDSAPDAKQTYGTTFLCTYFNKNQEVYKCAEFCSKFQERLRLASGATVVHQLELCPTIKRQHIQFAIKYPKSVPWKQAVNACALVGFSGANVRVAHKKEAALAYCAKEDTRDPDCTGGHGLEEATLTRREIMERDIVAGATDRVLAERHGMAFTDRYASASLYRVLMTQDRTEPPTVTVYWGPPGSGKSKRVWDYIRENDKSYCVFTNPTSPQHVHWGPSDMSGKQVCVIDDFDPALWSRTFWLNMCDRYPFQVRVLPNGFCKFNVPEIFITTNIDPNLWWPGHSWHADSWLRRITVNEHIT